MTKAAKPKEAAQPSPFRLWADRPDKEAISELCQHIAEGGHLAGFCRAKGFAYVTVLDWIAVDTDKGGRSEMYARAREDRADVLADEIVSIADEECVMVKHPQAGEEGGKAEVVFDSVAVSRNKLRVDARKWAASKLKPRSYGEKIQQEVSGPGGGPIQTKADLTLTPSDAYQRLLHGK